uniref:CSON008814 protein n=1 Tax=Culicoides sonorensis TaxID=179676 RepID=A0A336MXG9_CULSO
MWGNSFLSHLSRVAGHGGDSQKSKGPLVRYSAIPSEQGGSTYLRGPQVFLDLDVEDTVTCFCRIP